MYRLLSALALAGALGLLAGGQAAAQDAHVTVDAGTVRAKVTPLSFGVNTACWDAHLQDAGVPARLREAGTTILRFPGGDTADLYFWRDNRAVGDDGTPYHPAVGFDAFMAVARAAGADPIVTVNYGSNAAGDGGGDPAEAAAWVDYANNVKRYNVRFWEIGNEIYGNGFYNGSGWEEDRHAPGSKDAKARLRDARLGPAAYGANVNAFASAMRAKDPRVQIGVVLTAPGKWPDGLDPDWNTNVLKACGPNVDFAVVHCYPQEPKHETDAGLLSSPADVPGKVARLRPVLDRFCRPGIPIFLTETNSVTFDPGRQSVSLVNGLFAPDYVLTWLECGVVNVDWWDLHNGPVQGKNNGPTLYGTADFGDYGLLSNGAAPEPPAGTPLPAFHGLEMARLLAAPGDALVSAASDRPLLAAHAARRARGGLGLMLINKDPARPCVVRVSVTGARLARTGVRYEFGPSGAVTSRPVSGLGRAFAVTVPAYTVVDLVVSGGR